MAELINMPKLGFDMREGQLVTWRKKPGDTVKKGDVLAEIESDKATIEVESYVEGVVLQLLVNAGDWVPIGAPIMVVGQPGETVDLAALGLQTAGEKAAQTAPAAAQPAPTTAPATPVTAAGGDGFPEGVRASPLARRLAKERGIDITQVPGSGPQGRIIRADIEAALAAGPAAPTVRSLPPATPISVGAADQSIPTPRMRARIAERMTEAKQTIPHFYVTTAIDMGPALTLRQDLNSRLEAEGTKVTVNDMIVKAVALALREFPNLNASYAGETIVRHARINVGIAVAVENGLINVVSQDADKLSLAVMARNHAEMIARAREGKIRPEDVEGETFTVSNLGAYEVDNFIAIINPPAAAIVAVGSAQQVPVVANGELAVGWRMKASISADHRVTDGAEAARFLQRVKQILEDPLRLLM